MADPAPIRCGICKKGHVAGEPYPMTFHVRLHPDDVKDTPEIKPGLYACCEECKEKYRPIIHARTAANPPPDGNGYKTKPDGSPATVVPALAQFDGDWLM